MIFSGSLRFNMDPFGNHPDTELWDALGNAHLKEFIKTIPEGLDYECNEGGSNLRFAVKQYN